MTVRARAAVFLDAARAALAGMKAGWRQSLQCLDDVVAGADDRQVVLQCILDAPPEAAFAYWTEQRHLERWWGPTVSRPGCSSSTRGRAGRGASRCGDPTGASTPPHPTTVRYDELVPGERLVSTHGEPSGTDPRFAAVVTFDEVAGQTALSMRLVFDAPMDGISSSGSTERSSAATRPSPGWPPSSGTARSTVG